MPQSNQLCIANETRTIAEVLRAAHTAVSSDADHHFDNDALLRQELNVRINKDVVAHNLKFELRLYEVLHKEHESLLLQIRQRGINFLETDVCERFSSPPFL